MLTRMEYHLEQGESLSCHNSSLFQGMLMQRIDPMYGEILHRSELKPYSQYLDCQIGHTIWVLQTLTEDASDQLIAVPGLSEDDTVYLERLNMAVKITAVHQESLSHEELLQQTFFAKCPRTVKLRFVTPTAFKVQGRYRDRIKFPVFSIFQWNSHIHICNCAYGYSTGNFCIQENLRTFLCDCSIMSNNTHTNYSAKPRYQIYPTIQHIFNSLIQKYDAAHVQTEIAEDGLLEDLQRFISVIGYNLRSTFFSVEGITIPSFTGTLLLKISGPQQLVNLVHLLLRFGTYSGVGIKTAMGMGALQLVEKRKDDAYARNAVPGRGGRPAP